MLSILAPSKFVLTLHSVPPFFFESILAFILVILLAIPLIARVQMLFENPMNYFSLIPSESHKYHNTHNITIHDPIINPTPVISVNLQLDTIHPINSSSSVRDNLSNFDMKLIHPNYNVIGDIIMSSKNYELHNDNSSCDIKHHDYDYYRNKFIELNLKRQYGDIVPGNVVLNSHYLNTIDAKILAKINGKYQNDLFDFIDYPDQNDQKISYNPVNHFQKKPENTIKNDKSIETIEQNLEIDQVPEMIDFKERAQTPTSQKLRKRKLLSDNMDQSKFKNTLDKFKKLNESVSTPVNFKVNDRDSKVCKIQENVEKQKEQLNLIKRASTLVKVQQQQKIPKFEVDNLGEMKNHSSLTDKNEGLSINCPSVASSEAFSLNSCSSRQKPSRPTSSCGSGPRGFRNYKGKINTRPRSGGYFGWDIPDSFSDIPDNVDVIDENLGIIDRQNPTNMQNPTKSMGLMKKSGHIDGVDENLGIIDRQNPTNGQNPTKSMGLMKKSGHIDDIDQNLGIIDRQSPTNRQNPAKSTFLMKKTGHLKDNDVLPVAESVLPMGCDVNFVENQSSSQNPEKLDKIHKSRLPVRQTETSRREKKKIKNDDKKGFAIKTEDIASQVSMNDFFRRKNSEVKCGNDKMKIDSAECNKKLIKERKTISKENFKENRAIVDTIGDSMEHSDINTFNQTDQMKSLTEKSQSNLNYEQEKTIKENSMESSVDVTKGVSDTEGRNVI